VTAAAAKSRNIATEMVDRAPMTRRKPGAVIGRPRVTEDGGKTVGARLSEPEYNDLRTVAFLRGTTSAAIIRELVQQFLRTNPAPKLPKA
jgi:hypothetical protein